MKFILKLLVYVFCHEYLKTIVYSLENEMERWEFTVKQPEFLDISDLKLTNKINDVVIVIDYLSIVGLQVNRKHIKLSSFGFSSFLFNVFICRYKAKYFKKLKRENKQKMNEFIFKTEKSNPEDFIWWVKHY